MSLLSGFQINRAITAILTEEAASTPEGKRALFKLKHIGEPAIPKLIEALGNSENTATLEQLLSGLVRNSTLPVFIHGLCHPDERVVDGVSRVLMRSKDFNTNELFSYYSDENVSKTALSNVLMAHGERVNSNILLGLLDSVNSKVRPMLYRLLGSIIKEDMVPDIARRLDSKEPMIRAHLLQVLSHYDTAISREKLVNGLRDPSKLVRQTALTGLAKLKPQDAVEDICQLLSDPDITVQTAAIDTLTKIHAPNTVKYLINVLQDESEYVRRAAVEVLNEVGDQDAVKDLLNALRDVDWWVKVRAADALGAIGGPKVFDAILALIKDPDEFLRRTAVEILNTSKDPRAVDKLLEALKDEDWWVRERAVDALATIGDTRAVPYLIDMLVENPEAGQVVIRALDTLGDKRAIKPLLRQLDVGDNTVRKEALKALETLTDGSHAKIVQQAASQLINIHDDGLGQAADATMKTLILRYGNRDSSTGTDTTSSLADQPTLAFNSPDLSTQQIHPEPRAATPADSNDSIFSEILNPALLKPGTILNDRFKAIRKIGEGAFGVVWLVEDVVVNDRFILKFLNPHVAADKNMIDRFMLELRYARKVTHENIIRIYDLITIGKSYAISMEYFPSHSLADEFRNNKSQSTPFDIRRGLKLLQHLCRGMARAQAAGVVHRDLKPANILIGDNDSLKIVDFGLAAAASGSDSRLTKSGILVGTPTYMAPEQVRGKEIDSRTDIYTIGIIMYEMFTGEAPYKGDDSMAILFQHVEGKATPPREVNPEIPPQLEATILQALAVDPDERFQSFNELAVELALAEKAL